MISHINIDRSTAILCELRRFTKELNKMQEYVLRGNWTGLLIGLSTDIRDFYIMPVTHDENQLYRHGSMKAVDRDTALRAMSNKREALQLLYAVKAEASNMSDEFADDFKNLTIAKSMLPFSHELEDLVYEISMTQHYTPLALSNLDQLIFYLARTQCNTVLRFWVTLSKNLDIAHHITCPAKSLVSIKDGKVVVDEVQAAKMLAALINNTTTEENAADAILTAHNV